MNKPRKIRVLIVDDSAVVRRMIADALAPDPQIEVVGTAMDPYVAREKILELQPDVLTLDIEMPRMDGLTFLRILQQHRPMPVIVISSLTHAGSRSAMQALESGAVDVLAKPTSSFSIGNLGEQRAQRVRAAAVAQLRPPSPQAPTPAPGAQAANPGAATASAAPVTPIAKAAPSPYHPRQLLLFGASTGGTEALREVLTRLPAGMPGIAIAQHIPACFSRAFAERLNDLCAFEVREAADGDRLTPGLALVAPGDFHMTVAWIDGGYRVSLNQKPPVHHCRPAVDVLFRSAAQCSGARLVASLLTGMGSDGALGMQILRSVGATNIVQDEKSCVVFGMPRAAIQLGVVDQVLPLDRIAAAVVNAAQAQINPPPTTLAPAALAAAVTPSTVPAR